MNELSLGACSGLALIIEEWRNTAYIKEGWDIRVFLR
jgi:hypothetical protein